MKKIISLFTLLLVVFALVSCGDNFSEEVLEEADTFWHPVGSKLPNGWDPGEDKLKATSVKAISELGVDGALEVARTLAQRKVKYLYVGEITVGEEAGGFTTKVKYPDGKLYLIDGCYTFKVLKSSYSDLTGKYVKGQWIYDPKTAHAENLTPNNLFIPIWQEKVTEEGFAWNKNDGILTGAGTYYVIAAQYEGETAGELIDGQNVVYNYALGVLLKEAKTEGEAVAANKKELSSEIKWYAIGFKGWDDENAIELTKNAEGKWEGDIDLTAEEGEKEGKFYCNKSWGEGQVGPEEGNFKLQGGKVYHVVLDVANSDAQFSEKQ